MGKISEIVGIVTDGKLEENRVVMSELFYTIKVNFLDVEIPVLFSSYINNEPLKEGSKVRVKGCLMSDIRKGSYPKFYFYAHEMMLEDIDAECSNIIDFACTITKVRGFTTDGKCKDILSTVGADNNPLGTTSILYLVLSGGDARRLKDREKGYVIVGKGKLKSYKDVYEIDVTEVSNMNRIVS